MDRQHWRCVFCWRVPRMHRRRRSRLQLRATRAWRIAPEVSHYRYKEPGVMTNEGTLYGVIGSYTFFATEGRQSGGAPTPTATTRSPGPRSGSRAGSASARSITTAPTWTARPFPRAASTISCSTCGCCGAVNGGRRRFFNAVYAGLGYRYLNDDSSSQPGGYERESNYLYVPLGARKDFELTSRWDLALTGEFDVLLIGRQISHLSDADPGLPDVRNWQWPGFGAGLFVDFRTTGREVDLGLAPFVRYWWIAESDVSERASTSRRTTPSSTA